MPINKEWNLKNDISAYPRLSTDNRLHEAIYNMGLDEMVNAVEPDTTLRTGKEWAGVWTRDVSYSILLSQEGRLAGTHYPGYWKWRCLACVHRPRDMVRGCLRDI